MDDYLDKDELAAA